MLPEKFWQPWGDVDPALHHGGIPGVVGEGYVAPLLGDNPKTLNADLHRIFAVVRDSAASLSVAPGSDVEGPPVRNGVEEALRAYNWIAERILDRTKTVSTSFFQWTHARPPARLFALRPIRYPLRNEFFNEAVFFLLGMAVEIAESNANGLHANLDPSSSIRILAPLHHFKANMMRDYFDVEVAGEITLDELNALFEGIQVPATVLPSSETQTPPDAGAVAEALAGVDVLKWFPTDAEWAVFGRKHTAVYKPERLWQPEGTRGTTEDIAPETPTPAGTGGIAPG